MPVYKPKVKRFDKVPDCDICKATNLSVVWDLPTRDGPWAYICGKCLEFHAIPKVGHGIGYKIIQKKGERDGKSKVRLECKYSKHKGNK